MYVSIFVWVSRCWEGNLRRLQCRSKLGGRLYFAHLPSVNASVKCSCLVSSWILAITLDIPNLLCFFFILILFLFLLPLIYEFKRNGWRKGKKKWEIRRRWQYRTETGVLGRQYPANCGLSLTRNYITTLLLRYIAVRNKGRFIRSYHRQRELCVFS